MPMNVIEVAVYAMVLTTAHPRPFECVAVRPDGVNCTNGLAALPDNGGDITFNTGVSVLKDASGRVSLSDGTRAFMDSQAWVSFVDTAGRTLISARRTTRTQFRFSNGYTCDALPDQTMARCYKS